MWQHIYDTRESMVGVDAYGYGQSRSSGWVHLDNELIDRNVAVVIIIVDLVGKAEYMKSQTTEFLVKSNHQCTK